MTTAPTSSSANTDPTDTGGHQLVLVDPATLLINLNIRHCTGPERERPRGH